MTKWIPSENWDPVPGGFCSNCEFLADMDCSVDQSLPWFRLPIFGELGLNYRGSTAARDKRKVSFSVAVMHSYPVPSCDSNVRLQREAAADKAEKRAQRKAVWQQMRAENANPRVRSSGTFAPPSPAAASSASFASILSAMAPSIPARQPLTLLHLN